MTDVRLSLYDTTATSALVLRAGEELCAHDDWPAALTCANRRTLANTCTHHTPTTDPTALAAEKETARA